MGQRLGLKIKCELGQIQTTETSLVVIFVDIQYIQKRRQLIYIFYFAISRLLKLTMLNFNVLAICVACWVTSSRALRFGQARSRVGPLKLLPEALDTGTATTAILALGGVGAAINFYSYAKLQLETAQIVGGVPPNSVVTEMDAQDGKNVFYLAPGVDYTAIMLSSGQSKEKAAINEQLILESVGKANGALASATTGGGLKGKLRAKSQEIRPKTQDVVLSVGAIGRAKDQDKALVVNEAFRMLKPGGLFVFLEPGGDDVLSLVGKFFPLEIEVQEDGSPISAEMEGGSDGDGEGEGEGEGENVGLWRKRKRGGKGAKQRLQQDSSAAAAGVPRITSTKPGIVAAPVSGVPLRSFISGIAIRP